MNVALVLTFFSTLFIFNTKSSCILDLNSANSNPVNEYIAPGKSISFQCCSGQKWFFNPDESDKSEEILPITGQSTPKRYIYSHNSSVWLYIPKFDDSSAGTYVCMDENQEKSSKMILFINNSQADHLTEDFQVIEDYRTGFLTCPKAIDEEILLWKWRFLNRNTTSEELKVAQRDGDFGEFRIFNQKSNAKVSNYQNLGAKKVIWCQVKLPTNETKFYEISWKVYKAERPEIHSLKWNSLPIKEPFQPSDYETIDYILEGKAFRLVCSLKKTPEKIDIASVVWKVNNATVLRPPYEVDNGNLNNGQTSQLMGSSYHRSFNNQTFSDAITCSMRIRLVSDTNNKTEKIVETSITKPFDIILEPEIIKFEADPNGYEEGQEVFLECAFKANGKYTANVEFSSSRSEVESKEKWTTLTKAPNNGYTMATTASGLVVNFKNVGKQNHGTYRCVVENESKKISQKTDLKVISKPDVEISTEFKKGYYYRNNKPIQATCKVFGYPIITESEDRPVWLTITCDERKISLKSTDSQKVIEELTYKSDQLKGIKAQYSIQPEKLQGNCQVTCHYQSDFKDVIQIKEAKPPLELNYMKHICSSSRGMVFLFEKGLLPADSSPRSNITIIVGNYKPDAVVGGSKEKYLKLDIGRISPISLSELKPDTTYLFEWSFRNELGLSSFQTMKVTTRPEGPPPTPKEIYLFDKKVQSENSLSLGVKMTDDCPYIGGREELDDFIVKFPIINEANEVTEEWTENKVCKLSAATAKDKSDWSGDKFIICEVDLPARIDSAKVKISSRNRFGISSWQDKELAVAPAHIKSVQDNSNNRLHQFRIVDTIIVLMIIAIANA